MNSDCSRRGNIHSKHVLHSPDTGREEEGLCKVDSMHAEWISALHMFFIVVHCTFTVLEKRKQNCVVLMVESSPPNKN